MKQNSFRDIFSKYNTDKTDHDFYCPVYEELFFSLRDKVKLLFEIGVGHGGSIRGFRDYFPNAQVVGFEIRPDRRHFGSERAIVELGNATDETFVRGMIAKHGRPDIVIDDGSHMSKDMKASFGLLFPTTRLCYVIEDLGTQTPDYQNGHYINDSVPATEMIKDLVADVLLHRGSCSSIKAYPGICFFFK
jgi:hypothetical protein